MVDIAKTEGLEFRFDRIRPGNTFDAHRLLHLAATHDVQDTLKERFLRAYMTEGEPIGDPQVLTKLAVQAGLDPDRVASVLTSDTYAREVRDDEAKAHENGISGVPFFAIGRYGVSGAQPAETLMRVLTSAWEEASAAPVSIADATVCGPEGCV
jgi:predicted DsbA family dithiol-disulfide isomerase